MVVGQSMVAIVGNGGGVAGDRRQICCVLRRRARWALAQDELELWVASQGAWDRRWHLRTRSNRRWHHQSRSSRVPSEDTLVVVQSTEAIVGSRGGVQRFEQAVRALRDVFL